MSRLSGKVLGMLRAATRRSPRAFLTPITNAFLQQPMHRPDGPYAAMYSEIEILASFSAVLRGTARS